MFDSLRKGTTSIETAVQENIDDIQWLQTSMKYLPSKVVDRKVLYIHGETGIGKTTTTCKYLEEKGLSFYIYNSTAGFLDGYCGQDVIVMDDFRSQLPLVTFLSMTSMYSTPIPVKGSSFPNMSSRIIITSNKTVYEQYTSVDHQPTYAAYLRRVANDHHCVSCSDVTASLDQYLSGFRVREDDVNCSNKTWS